MPRAIGIDLGTTNSLVAHVDERNRPRILPVDEGRPLLPSAVHYGTDGEIDVGAAAKRGSKIRARVASSMPQPLSPIEMRTLSPST